jgi:hypothetical protein
MSETSTTDPNQTNTDVLRTRAMWKALGVVVGSICPVAVLLLTRNKLQKMFPIFDSGTDFKVTPEISMRKSYFDISGGR